MNTLHKYCQNPFGRSILRRKIQVRYPHERTFLQLAKLVDAHRVGPFTLGHYQSNPRERPDHITTSVCRFRSASTDDYECLSWKVAPATTEDINRFPDRGADGVSEHLVALSDDSGNIVLFDFMSEEQARRSLAAAAQTGCPRLTDDGWNPLSSESTEFVTSYPLTREEVRLLAVHWALLDHDNSVFCSETGQSGSTEIRITRYTDGRLGAAADVLGMHEIDAVIEQAKTVWAKFGPDGWAAFDRPPAGS